MIYVLGATGNGRDAGQARPVAAKAIAALAVVDYGQLGLEATYSLRNLYRYAIGRTTQGRYTELATHSAYSRIGVATVS